MKTIARSYLQAASEARNVNDLPEALRIINIGRESVSKYVEMTRGWKGREELVRFVICFEEFSDSIEKSIKGSKHDLGEAI